MGEDYIQTLIEEIKSEVSSLRKVKSGDIASSRDHNMFVDLWDKAVTVLDYVSETPATWSERLELTTEVTPALEVRVIALE